MTFILKAIGAVVLGAVLLIAVAVWDLTRNGGGLIFGLAGRDDLVRDCSPRLKQELIGRGFSPVDLEFAESSAVEAFAGSLGRSRRLAGAFTFSDGQNGPRVDGRFACSVAGGSVKVEVDVDDLPHRVT